MKYGLRTSIFIGAMATLLSCSVNDAKQKVDSVYDRMSDEQRAAQLGSIYLSKFFTPEGTLDTAKCRELIPYGAGHFSQFAMDMGKTADEQRDMVAAMQAWLMENTGIPALFHEEALVGVNSKDATVYPQQIGLACSFDPILAEQKTIQTATALRSMGGRLVLSPMVDVVRNPSFNRLEESYGEDAYLSAAMGVAFVKGLQHGDRLKQEGIPACTKHFLGYGGGGDTGKKELMEEILLPHEAIIRTEGSRVVMTGYHAVDGVKCVAWPFGFGRSYASFEYSDCSVPEKVSTAQQSFNVTVDVANVSDVPADEIVQFYLSPLEENSGLKPIQLKGFARVSLAPREKKKLGVKMFTDQLAYFSEGKWIVDPGRYIIKVGASSRDIRCEKQITLEGGRRSMALRTNYISEIL